MEAAEANVRDVEPSSVDGPLRTDVMNFMLVVQAKMLEMERREGIAAGMGRFRFSPTVTETDRDSITLETHIELS